MGKNEAIVAVLRRSDRVLVIRRGPQTRRPGFWAPLSGKIEPGETQEEALIREVNEEVGLHVSPLAKVWESQSDDGHFLLHWWTAEAEAGDVQADPAEVSDARWVTAEEFLRMDPTFPADREFFDRIHHWAFPRP